MKTYLMSSVALAVLAPTVAVAQDRTSLPMQASGTASPDSGRLDEIIVTAQKRPETLQNVPISVNVVTGDQLQRARIADVLDLAKVSPSITITESTSPQASNILIRGVGTFSFNSNVEPSVSVVIDGVPLFRLNQAFTDFVDLARIEVLRGPQGTLFGKNASAGVLSITTATPDRDLHYGLNVSVFEGAEYRAQALLSGPVSDTLSASLAVNYRHQDDFQRNAFDGRGFNGQRTYGIRGQLVYRPSDSFSVRLIGDYTKFDLRGAEETARLTTDLAFLSTLAAVGVTPGPSNRTIGVNAPSFSRSRDFGAAMIMEQRFPTVTLTSITGYRGSRNDSSDDVDDRPNVEPVTGNTQLLAIRPPGTTATPLFPGVFLIGPFDVTQGDTSRIDQVSEEIRLASNSDSKLQFVGGIFALVAERTENFSRLSNGCLTTTAGLAVLPFTPAGTPCSKVPFGAGFTLASVVNPLARADLGVRNVNAAAFGQATYALTDALSIIGGLRYQYDEIRVSVGQPFGSPLPGFSPTAGTSAGITDKFKLTGRGGVQYKFGSAVTTYATYARGYKAPTAGYIGNGQFNIIAPETSNAYEVGLKSSLLDRHLTVNLAGFWTDFQNFQGETYDPLSRSFTLNNAGKVRTRGVEAEIAAKPVRDLTLSIGTAYTDATYTSFINAPCFNPRLADPLCRQSSPGVFTRDLSGQRLANSPRFKMTADVRYEAPLSDRLSAFVDLNGRYQTLVNFEAGGDTVGNPNTIQNGFGIVDAHVGLISGGTDRTHYELSLDVNNVFDHHFVTLLYQDFVIVNSANINQRIPKQADRFFGGTLRIRM